MSTQKTRIVHTKKKVSFKNLSYLFDVRSYEHDIHATGTHLVDDQEPIDDKSTQT